MNSKQLENQKFLQNNINPLLERLVSELMIKTPEEPVSFMVKWLGGEGSELQTKLKNRQQSRPEGLPSSEEDLNEDEEEYVEELGPKTVAPVKVGARTSVSAEVYGEHFKKQAFVPPVYQKSDEKKQDIFAKLSNSMLFSNLVRSDLEIIVNAMKIVNFPANSAVIVQGEPGDEMFVVDDGQLDCFKTNANGEKQHLTSYSKGQLFGELALMYNAPRAANVYTLTDCVLLSLDRQTFNFIVREAITKRQEQYVNLLSRIEVLSSLSPADRDRLADCIQLKDYKNNEVIIRQGDAGDRLFFVIEGRCQAVKTDPSTGPGEAFIHEQGDYFGELALLNDDARKATVTCIEESTLASIDRASFNRLLGPLKETMQQNLGRYVK